MPSIVLKAFARLQHGVREVVTALPLNIPSVKNVPAAFMAHLLA